MIERAFMHAHTVLGYQQTGSSYIVNPPVLDTDEDWVVLVHSRSNARVELAKLGYTLSSKDMEKYKTGKTDPFAMYNSFDAFRHPDTNENLIVVDQPYTFLQWKTATALAKKLNLTNKEDRIELFRAIRSGGVTL